MNDYSPVSCSFHDQLEHLAIRRTKCRFAYRQDDGEQTAEGRIADIRVSDGAEYAIIEPSGLRIRLDRILKIEPTD